ncbi:MAG: TetR/AcrR family transcriptional regulator [Lautropia sp.]
MGKDLARVSAFESASSAQAPAGKGPRARTYRMLLAEAMRIVGRGHIPSVAEVAQGAGVSRATAYRYFPSRSKLILAMVGEALGPVREFEPTSQDGAERINELFDQTFPRFREYEPHLRAALQLAIEHEALERAGLLEEEPFRRGHRVAILRRTAGPLRAALGARSFDRMVKALSLVYGIEPYVVLKDIWGSSDREVQAISKWMLNAIVDTALREAAPPRSRASSRGGPRGRRG